MRTITLILIFFTTLPSFSQIRIYSGYIDKYPITLTTYSYSDGVTRGIYAYDKYDTPIQLNGVLKNDTLALTEMDNKGKETALLKFIKFNPALNRLNGKWTSSKGQNLDVRLDKLFEFDSYDSSEFESKELIQPESTSDHYFKLLISKKSGEDVRVFGVRVYQKKTDKLIQEIEMDCQFWGLHNISVGDYNFDGITDFSVFEASYAGPNTSSIYILRNPNSEQYIKSDFSGTSLEFDYDSKLIYEHNQCCAGRSHMNAIYKVINNEMVLIEQKCLEYDDEKEDFIETKCE